MKVNVMGATGNLGSRVIRELLKQGAIATDIIASTRHPEKASELAQRGVEVRRADYEDPQSLKEAFLGTDVLLLIPSSAPVEPRIQQHFNALEAAKQSKVGRVLLTSILAATSTSKFLITPFTLYSESKLCSSGLEWTILRNCLYLDPVAQWVPKLIQMGYLPYPVKKGRVAYISRDDLARALAAACLGSDRSGQIYQLTGNKSLSMPELAQTISQVTGKHCEFKSVSEDEFADICRADNLPELMIEVLTSMYRAVDNEEFDIVTDHVERLTGTPPESVESYLRRTWRDIYSRSQESGVRSQE